MDDSEDNHIVVMDRLLQRAFTIHKESTRAISSNLVKTKSAYYKTLDKCQQLQKQNEDLKKKLKEYLSCMQRCPNCSSLSSHTDKQYKKNTFENEDRMKLLSNISTNVVNAAADDGDGNDDDDDLVFGEEIDSSDIGKFKLQRKQNKRCRNSQESLPEHKRARKLSPKLQKIKSTVSELDEKFSQKFSQDSPMKNNKAIPGKRVLVPDTCALDMLEKTDKKVIDHKFKMGNKDLDKLSDDPDLDLNVGENLSLLVVPETMGMDMEDFGMDDDDNESDENDDNGIGRHTCTDSSSISDLDETVKEKSGFTLKESKKKSEEDGNKRRDRSEVDKFNVKENIPVGIKSLLMSPETDGVETSSKSNVSEKLVNGNVQDGVLCKNSDDDDDDSDDDKIPCSYTFGKSKHHFRKNKSQSRHLEDETELILRRSPRKHKSSMFKSPSKLSQKNKTKRCLPITIHPLTTAESPKSKTRVSPSKSKSSLSLNKSIKIDDEDFVDCDETIAPENCPVDSTLKDNLSMDCYTVVPLDGGQIDVKNQFQVKVAKSKSNKKYEYKDFDTDSDFAKPSSSKSPESVDNALKSPSLLGGKAKIHSSNSGKVEVQGHSKNRSPIESVSSSRTNSFNDQMSPSIVSGEKIKTSNIDSENSDWMSKKDKKVRRSCSQDTSSRSQQRSSVRSLQKKEKIRKSGSLYSFNFDPDVKVDVKNMHQTTLTQSFFSPKMKNDKKEKKVSKSVTSEVDEIETDHVFKKPDIKYGKKSKTKQKSPVKSITDDENNIVTTTTNDDDDVLIDITSDINNDNDDMNRSMDPDLDLSKWCNDVESLPSLDTDLENVNPENDNLTMEDSFDCLPKKPKNDIAHIAVVRKRDERQKLQGHGCKQCLEYYKSAGRSEEEIKNHMCQCSRHRAQYVPPDTPPHFWSIGFMDTQECNIQSEKKKDNEESADVPSRRRRKKLTKYFKAKNEMSMDEDSQEIL
ncbi:DNA endonuclease rbbp8 [Mactra antiquata]